MAGTGRHIGDPATTRLGMGKIFSFWRRFRSILFFYLAAVGRGGVLLVSLDGPRMSFLPESVCSCSVVPVWRGPESRPLFLRGSEGFVWVAVRSGPGMKMLSTDILLEEFHILHLVRYL